MTVNLSLLAGAGWQFSDNNGVPLTGGLLYTYAAGTTTPATTYTSSSGGTANTNPIVLDSAGRVPGEVWLTAGSTYKFILQTSASVLIGSWDNIAGANDFTSIASTYVTIANLANTSDVAKGDALVGFKQSNASGALTNAQAKTVHDKLQDLRTAQDFGAVGDGSADNALAFTYADAAGAFALPPGNYKVSSNITIANQVLFMEGAKILPDTGVTVTFSKPVTAACVQIFGGDGAVVLPSDQGEVNVMWWGAVGDGTTDCTDAFQAAITTATDVYIPATASGFKIASARLTITARKHIYGDFVKSKILHSNDDWLFDIQSSFVHIEGLQIDASAATLTGRGIALIRSDLAGYERIWFTNIETDQSFQFLRDGKNGTNLLVNIQLENIICRRHRGNGIDIEDGFAYCRFRNITVDYVNSSSKNHTAYRMVNNAGSVWENVDVTGGQVDGTTTSQHGFFFDNCIAIWMNNCMADTVGGYGFYFFSDCRAFYMVSCVGSLCGYSGFYMSGTGNFNMSLVNCISGGRVNQTYKPANQAGFFFLNLTGLNMSNCRSLENTGDGIYIQDSTAAVVTGGGITSNTLWGLHTVGTNGGIYSGIGINQPSSSGNASLATTIDQLVSCQLTSGAVGSLTGPGTI